MRPDILARLQLLERDKPSPDLAELRKRIEQRDETDHFAEHLIGSILRDILI